MTQNEAPTNGKLIKRVSPPKQFEEFKARIETNFWAINSSRCGQSRGCDCPKKETHGISFTKKN